jgi:hypothetical protein
MKTRKMITMAAMIALGAFTFQSCKEDEDVVQEYIADDNSFKSFMSWTLEATHQGPDPALGPAHGGNDSTVVREVFFKDGQDIKDGEYPVGTLIVKHSHNPGSSVNEFTALAKRGNDFNTDGGDWEWFVLNSDGTIAVDDSGNKLRGADLMGGMCLNCHTGASSKDYVFSK